MNDEQTTDLAVVASARANLGEGPVWDPRVGTLYWTDITAGTIHMHDHAGGATRSIATGNEMLGCLFLTQTPGILLLARESGLYRFDTTSGVLEFVADPIPNQHTHRFNDGKCDALGRIWIGTMATFGGADGALYCLTRDLTATQVVAPIAVPNGLAWSQDGTTLYHVDTAARAIRAYNCATDKPALSAPIATIDCSGFDGMPDGMTIDQEGMLWVAFWEGRSVRRIDPIGGRTLATIELPCRYVTSCTFGGPELRDLYITTAAYEFTTADVQAEPLAGSLFRVYLDVGGMPEHTYRLNGRDDK